MRLQPWFMWAVLACSANDDHSGHSAETDTDSDVDSDTDTDADTDADTDTCLALTAGRWDLDGPAFGMAMDADLAMDVDGCSFTFANWNMSMSVPDGGTVSGSNVTFTGSSYWTTCTGTATSKADASGTCSDDGANWTMTLSN